MYWVLADNEYLLLFQSLFGSILWHSTSTAVPVPTVADLLSQSYTDRGVNLAYMGFGSFLPLEG